MEINSNFSEKAIRDYMLVLEAKKGNQKAFNELLELYRNAVYFMLLKMVKNNDDAEDLTIEAFGKAFNNLDLYTPTYAFSTWLFKIASNNGIDFLRWKKNNKNLVSIDETEEAAESPSNQNYSLIANIQDPEEKMISKQKEKLLSEIITNLHDDYKEIIKLRFYDELSYSEIAERLNIPLGTVKARLFRSRELISAIMKRKELGFE